MITERIQNLRLKIIEDDDYIIFTIHSDSIAIYAPKSNISTLNLVTIVLNHYNIFKTQNLIDIEILDSIEFVLIK